MLPYRFTLLSALASHTRFRLGARAVLCWAGTRLGDEESAEGEVDLRTDRTPISGPPRDHGSPCGNSIVGSYYAVYPES